MTFVACVLVNYTERICHQRYWHFLLEAMGEEVGTCPICKKKFTEEPRVWTEADEIPETV